MARFVGKRMLAAIPVAIGVATVVFFVIRIGGDPVNLMLGVNATPEAVAELRDQLGLDEPIGVQYLVWLQRIPQGDLGDSLVTGEPVSDIVLRRSGPTLVLAISSLIIAVVAGISMGMTAATHPRSWIDRSITAVATLGVSAPSFWVGLTLIFFFSVELGWFPTGGMFSPVDPQWTDVLQRLVLPAITLALPSIALIARLTRSSMLEIMEQDYVRVARAKGVHKRHVVRRHALRNALIPVVTIVGIQFGYLLGGAVIVESIFAWPGLGSLMLDSISSRDFPVVQGAVLYIAFAFVLTSLVVDVLYGFLNPRIRVT